MSRNKGMIAWLGVATANAPQTQPLPTHQPIATAPTPRPWNARPATRCATVWLGCSC